MDVIVLVDHVETLDCSIEGEGDVLCEVCLFDCKDFVHECLVQYIMSYIYLS